MCTVKVHGDLHEVSGLRCCETCKWASIADGARTITTGTVTIHQHGKRNVACLNTSGKNMDLVDGEIRCSGWEYGE